MERYNVDSVFKRLFALFLVVIAVVYALLTVLLVQYVRKQREAELSVQASRVVSAAASIEEQIKAALNLQRELFADVRLAKLGQAAYSDNYERSRLILELLSSIQNTYAMNGIIDDIVLAFPHQQVELSARNGYHRQAYASEQFQTERKSIPKPLVYQDGTLMMRISSPLLLALDETDMPDYTVQVSLSTEYLDRFIQSFRGRELAGAFWAVTGESAPALLTEDEGRQALLLRWAERQSEEALETRSSDASVLTAGDTLFVSMPIPQFGLALVAHQESSEIGWKLGVTLAHMGMILLVMGGMFGLLVVWANRSISKPVYKIMHAFEQLQSGDLDVRIYHDKRDEFSYLYESFNRAGENLKELVENSKEQAILLQKAEQLQLQSQINPHFLYNSFYSIKFLAKSEACEQIDALATALAQYYRFLNKETAQTISLQAEAAHMANYVEIQQMRFGDRISVAIAPVPEEAASFRVPKLILQPILENAYNHGFKNTLAGGLLTVSYRLEGEYLLIIVEDNGSFPPEQLEPLRARLRAYEGEAANHAMTNIARRLSLAYGSECGVFLAVSPMGGLQVTLKLNTTVHLS